MIKVLVQKVGNPHDQMDMFSTDMKTVRQNQTEILGMKKEQR